MELKGTVKLVVDYIYNKILNGELALGEPVSEMKLAQELNISRSPIREAIKVLEGEGILIHYSNRGTIVADITVKLS